MQQRRKWMIPLGGFLLVLLHHAAWYGAFPQYRTYPPDQAGYLAGGHAIFSDLASLARNGLTRPVISDLRSWFDFLGVGLVYGAIDALRPNDLGFARAVLAWFNALSAVGVYELARRLASPAAGAFALLFFVLSPAFPAGASRLYPDAITGCLIVWSVRLFVQGGGFTTAAGVLAGAAMLIRVQMLPWVPLGLTICSVAALLLGVGAEARAAIRRGWIGLSLPLLVFAGLAYFGLENKNDSAPKHNLPRYHYYAYGFWQYLESDGWEGPYRLKKDPFYVALLEESKTDPELLRSRPRQYVFAAFYVAARLDKAIPIVIGNFYRIFDRPQNPEHRGFIGDDALTWIHRLALVTAVVAAVDLYASGSLGFVAPLLILSLGVFHALAWGWPRYAMPVLPVLLALSGLGLERVILSIRDQSRAWLAALLAGGILWGGALLAQESAPEAGWALKMSALLLALAAFVLIPTRQRGRAPAPAAFIFAAGLCLVAFGNAWRDRNWHEQEIALRPGDVVRQEIRLDSGATATLRGSHDRYVAVDLRLKGPSRHPWPVRINGIEAELRPSIPPLPESIPVEEEGRAYPQWWVSPLTDAMLDRIATDKMIVVELTVDDPSSAVLKADRFRGQGAIFEAPSLGDWPLAAGIKPEYDHDFRLVARMPLSSRETTTAILRAGAAVRPRAVARIRAIELDDREGSLVLEARRVKSGAKAPLRGVDSIVGFAGRAVMRNRGEALITASGDRLIGFEIAPFRNDLWTGGAFRLCYRDRTPDKSQGYESRGLYLLSGPLPCAGDACRIEARFFPGMDDRPMGFSAEPAKSQPTLDVLQRAAIECGFTGSVQWTFD
ncbi:MAG: hypothetical protein ABI565_13570, partial [Vicinamibacteria bacterium]